MPRTAFAPRPGASVPRDPTLYVFQPRSRFHEYRAVADNEEVPVALTGASQAFGVTFHRIDVTTGEARTLSLFAGRELLVTYSIDPAWIPATPEPDTLDVHYVREDAHCSYVDAHVFNLTAAPAYQIEYAVSAAAFAAGDVERVFAPRHVDDYFYTGGEHTGGGGRVALGFAGRTFAPSSDARSVPRSAYVCVRALHADGSVSAPCQRPGLLTPFGYFPPDSGDTPADRIRWRAGLLLVVCGFAVAWLGWLAARRWLRALAPARRVRVYALSDWRVPHVLFVAMLAGTCGLIAYVSATPFASAGEAWAFAIASAVWAFVAGVALGLTADRNRDKCVE